MLSKEDLFFVQHSPRVLDEKYFSACKKPNPTAKPAGALQQAATPSVGKGQRPFLTD
jgi:hypothetical protein